MQRSILNVSQEKKVDMKKDKLLDSFRNVNLFSKAGQAYENFTGAKNLTCAIDMFDKTDWDAILQEIVNKIWAKVDKIDYERSKLWNGYIKEYNGSSQEIENNIKKLSDKIVKKDVFSNFLNEIFRIVFAESFYHDIIEESYIFTLLEVILDGHLPCGWVEGEFPKGKLIVW
jgi:hypothetical protein